MIAENPIDLTAPGPPPNRFGLGKVVATPGALEALERTGHDAAEFLGRHQAGDWGEVGAADAQANDDALASRDRLLSAYRLRDQTKVWIITQADRSSTCMLLPDEY